MAKRKVVLTGAAGYVAQRMFAALAERYELVSLDVKETDRAGRPVPGVRVCDLTQSDRDAYRAHFRGADTVVHCAIVRTPRPAHAFRANDETEFRAEYLNVGMAYNVYRTAQEEGLRRVVVCSSNHAADYYERLIWDGQWDVVTPEMLPKSDNFYGWAKACYEHLGFVFATGKAGGRALENVQIRIGGPRDGADLDQCPPGDIARLHRGLGAFLSARDQAQLFIKSIEAPTIADEHGVPFQIFYGVSGNTHNFWSIANARRVIGYAPEDNSQVLFADRIAAIARG
ncbi:MAG: NAD(P)-dependent oxidoreductase [Candidatus Lambdaproteobacteria bacterium]|nr:NAD(P)-dependent oxidoreductase [Candidatus Lambdaproteobacteria bacterium]